MLVQPTTTQTQTEGRMERLHLALYNLSDFYVLLTLCHVRFPCWFPPTHEQLANAIEYKI